MRVGVRDGTVFAQQENRMFTLGYLFVKVRWKRDRVRSLLPLFVMMSILGVLADSSLAETSAASAASTPEPLALTGELLTDLPPNLRVPHDLRPLLQQTLQRSPTFQRQMKTLLHTQRVRMSVVYGGLRGLRLFQAQSTVTHHEWGALVVDTTLYAPADMVELVAHELEHVCEQIEGIDLPSLAGRHDSGVYDVGGHFETLRAIVAGRRVTREAQGLPVDEQAMHVTF
jgi:hypothetical protein